ncbi:MAG TPA: ArsI/CadI family heavy metal resistance metalloenzyme [Sphingomicrobium sp.]|nr:ArsI/CadI family heavy metal resistance metalloenzyme [Sphingomicrobium sp.]
MNRLHVHVSVEDLGKSVGFYSALFGAEPAVLKDDYAKWMVDDPRVNFAISRKGDNPPGLNHLGIQSENEDELAALYRRLGDANIATIDESCARCCYAESDKHWAVDPTGIVWEAYRTMGEIAMYGADRGAGVDPLIRDEAKRSTTAASDPETSNRTGRA